ncbi:MAG: DNA polymerase III subunit delta' [Planctomycetales bacterium]|nr:DNA polymerase III subunit delta' [Planctomycetales bacterium]
MSWLGVEGHDAVAEQFARAMARGRLANSFVFCGEAGIGKRLFAERLAQSLLCLEPPDGFTACGACASCRQARSLTHPDLHVVTRPEGRANIPVDLLIGDSDHRMRTGFCYEIAMKPFLSRRKVGIIDDADWLGVEGANSLLKTLEEPPLDSVLILIATSVDKQLPTIRSRCQTIRFAPLDDAAVARILRENELVSETAEAEHLAAMGGGSVARAVAAGDEQLRTFRAQLFDRLGSGEWDTLALAADIGEFVGKAGREAAVRRERLGQIIDMVIDFYRGALRDGVGAERDGGERVGADTIGGDVEALERCLHRSFEAAAQLQRNVHLTTLVDAWIDDLGRIVRHDAAAPR